MKKTKEKEPDMQKESRKIASLIQDNFPGIKARGYTHQKNEGIVRMKGTPPVFSCHVLSLDTGFQILNGIVKSLDYGDIKNNEMILTGIVTQKVGIHELRKAPKGKHIKDYTIGELLFELQKKIEE